MANIDQLNQLLFKEFRDVISVLNVNQHHINIKDALLKKRARANSTEEYIQSLIQNVAYIFETTSGVEQIIEHFINNKNFPSQQNGEQLLVNHQESIKSNMSTIAQQYVVKYNKYPTNQQKSENLEFDYSFYITYQELSFGMFFKILNSPLLKSELLKYKSSEVIELFKYHCNGLTNTILENIK